MRCLQCCGPAIDASPKGSMTEVTSARDILGQLGREIEPKLSDNGQALWKGLHSEVERLYEENATIKQGGIDIRGDLEMNEELASAHRQIKQLQQELDQGRDEIAALRSLVSRLTAKTGGLEEALPEPMSEEHNTPGLAPTKTGSGSTNRFGVAEDVADDKLALDLKSPNVSVRQDTSGLQHETRSAADHHSEHQSSTAPISFGGSQPSHGTKANSAKGKTSLASQRISVSVPLAAIGMTRQRIKWLFNSQAFVLLSAICLAIALFGERLYVIFNVPDEPGNYILDTVMLTIMLVFAVEICGTYYIDPRYRWSFFMWMDILGTVSMVFEISFLLASLEVDTVVLRTTRVAKLGARLGRLLKLLKFFLKKPDEDMKAKAKVLTQNLTFSLATRVSALTIVLLCTLPLFSLPVFPTEDLSMLGWAQWIEDAYAWNSSGTNLLDTALGQLQSFYDDKNYGPYKIKGYDFQYSFTRDEPARENNRVEETLDACLASQLCNGGNKPSIFFDFTGSNQLAAFMDIAMIIYIMFMMVFMTSVQIYTIDQMLVKPLERMLQVVRVHAKEICDRFVEIQGGSMAPGTASEAGDLEQQESSELELLESVLRKIARLVEVHTANNRMFASELSMLDVGGQAVLMEMLETKVVRNQVRPPPRRSTQSQADGTTKAFREWLAFSEQSGTWNLDVLQQPDDKLLDLVMHFFYVHEVGCAADLFTTHETLREFCRVVRDGYKDLPYHCFRHAIDVLHCVSVVLSRVQSQSWLSEAEVYALMVAALAHDVGHGGKTNQFLVEVKDFLALRYNDKSPLENMHCATLFQICNNEACSAFSKASAQDKKESRNVCIAAILHTDNAGHFQMVKEITGIYELEKEICDLQAKSKIVLERYECEILHKDKQKWLELWLHFADIANPLKPFPICKAWAWRVLDEFFAQGDEEKKLGLPVGMLNDRSAVNRPGSQHGFINFLVSPLVATTVKLFPALQELHWQMACNLEEWKNIWVIDCSPSAEDIAKKDADVKKIKDVAEELKSRSKR